MPPKRRSQTLAHATQENGDLLQGSRMQSHKHAKTKSSSDSQVNSSNDGKDPRLSAITNDGELEGQEHHREMLAAFRCLIADLCEQFGGGHPGGAMGMAAIGVALWGHVMRYSPHHPLWFARDRFVLSNGHCCLFQYAFLHLTGYSAMTWDQLKSYHSVLPDSLCPGHPEVEIDGIEVTTGPLGQGIANAVGLAMATEHLAATYNRPGYDVVNNMTYCTVGDACLQEGVGLEALSIAGHLRLRRLVVLYDNNQITCDGSVDMCNSEDVNAKMSACGWEVIDIEDGCFDVEGIVAALEYAKSKAEDRPTFINCHTVIGVGSKIQGKAQAHGAALGAEDIRQMKQTYGQDPDEYFVVPEVMREFFANKLQQGRHLEAEYQDLFERYARAHPQAHAELRERREGRLTGDPMKFLPKVESFPDADFAGRKSAGLVLNPIAQNINSFMVGTADLSPSVAMAWKDKRDFQHPDVKTECGINGDYTGRYIHWGIREHAMASISNGLSAFNRGTIIPVTSSFFMFYIYAAAGIRMGALQQFQQIHIATHDSIGTGEDGPTHQPIELATLYRAMPNILYIRPCDTEEAAGAVLLALAARHMPSMISVSRQNQPQYHAASKQKNIDLESGKALSAEADDKPLSSRAGVQKGGYVLCGGTRATVTLLTAGAELRFAVAAREHLRDASSGALGVRIVSMPCWRVFEAQPADYRRGVLRRQDTLVVAVEAYAMTGWERYADAGYGMATFGHSLPGAEAYKKFGFDGANIAGKVRRLYEDVRAMGSESTKEGNDASAWKHQLASFRADEGFRELNEENYGKSLELLRP